MEKRQPIISLAGVGSILLATTIYGLFGVLSRFIGYTLPFFYISGLRSLTAAVVLLVLLPMLGGWRRIPQTDFFWIALRSLCGFSAFYCVFSAFNHLPIGSVYFIFYAASTLVAYGLGYLLFGERVTIVKTISLVLALAGLYFLYSFSLGTGQLWYVVLSLLAGIGNALWTIIAKKISATASGWQLTFVDTAFSGLAGLLLSLVFQESWSILQVNWLWGANLVFALFFVFTGPLVINGFRKLDAQIASLLLLMEVVLGAVFGWLIYTEILPPLSLAGGILIVIGIALPEVVNVWRSRQ